MDTDRNGANLGSLTKGRTKRRTTTMGKATKHGKAGFSRYIDDIAEEDEDEDLDGKTELARFKLEEEDKEMRSEMERQDRRRNQEKLFKGEDADVAGVVKSLHERYQRTTRLASDLDDIVDDGANTSLAASRYKATRQANAPTLTDPRLWVVPCKIGCEREAVLSLMNKCSAMARTGQAIGICGAMATSLRGYVYLESRSEPAARAAAKGLRLLRTWSMKMVPMGDMVAVVSTDLSLKTTGSAKGRCVRVGDWARVSRDKYRHDLCRIVALGDGGTSAVIMLVPRVSIPHPARESRGHNLRPPTRLFNAAEVIAAGGKVSQQRFRLGNNAGAASRNWALSDEVFDIYENNSYLRGFLYKEVNVATMLQTLDANPTLDELQRFVIDLKDHEHLHANPDLKKLQGSLITQVEALAQGIPTSNSLRATGAGATFARNDKVEVLEGEMQGLAFVVERVSATGIVHCKALEAPHLYGCTIPMEAHCLTKSIPVGAHVKAREGKYAGQTGVILERGVLEGEHVAVILTDCGGREITVRLAHINESSEISRGLDALEGFELHDLILLPLGAIGVIIHVGTDSLKLLMSRGQLRTVRPAEIVRKLNQESARNVSLDSKDEQVRESDYVILNDGDDAGALAAVIRTYRASLWLLKASHSATTAPRCGLIVKKARQVHVAGDRASGHSLAETYMGLGRQRVVDEDQFNHISRSRETRRGFNGRDPVIGRTVRICKGSYKGLAGIVTSATSTHFTVELHTRSRSVTQPRECVKIVAGTAGGEPELAVQQRAAEQEAYSLDLLSTPFLTQPTPLLGGATPQYGAATPHHSTPSHSSTPAHGFQTPRCGSQPAALIDTSTPGCALTPSHHLEDVWRPQPDMVSGRSGYSTSLLGMTASPGRSGFTGGKSPATGGSRTSTPVDRAPPLLTSPADAAWYVKGAEARVDNGQICKIMHIHKNTATIAFKATPSMTRSLPLSEIRRVDPKAGNKVVVTDGGRTYHAELLSIEGSDGIIKLESGEYKIIDFSAVAKAATF